MKTFRPLSRFVSSSAQQASHSSLPSRLALSQRSGLTPQSVFHLENSSYQPFRLTPFNRRFESTAATSPSAGENASPGERPKRDEPAYVLTFTCKPCTTRSSHRISKQAYHYGAALIKCPGCGNRHVMSDHLGIFTDKGAGGTLGDILAKYGTEEGTSTVKKGYLEGDLEFWDDGTVKRRGGKLDEIVETLQDISQKRASNFEGKVTSTGNEQG